MPKTEQEAAENWDLGGDLWRKGPRSFQMLFVNVSPVQSHRGARTGTQEQRGLVLKHDKAIIDLPDRESSTKKARGTEERGVGRAAGTEGEAKDRLPEEWAWIQTAQMQNPSVLVNLD